MPPRKNTRRKTRGLPRCLDELDMEQDDITKYFKPKNGAAWTVAEVELIKRRIATADRKIATLQLEKERLLNVLHEVPVELLSPGGPDSPSPRPSKVKVVDISQANDEANLMTFTNPYADREAAVIRIMGRISYCCVDDLLAPSERPALGTNAKPAEGNSKASASSLEIPARPEGLPSPFPRVLDQHGPYLSNYPTVPGFLDDYDELFVMSNTELVATADELESTLTKYLDPRVYSRDDLHYFANNAVDFLSRLYAGVERNKAKGVRLDAVKRYLEELFKKHPRPKVPAEDTPPPAAEPSPSLARNMQLTHFCEPQESPQQPVEPQQDIDQTELMDDEEEPVPEALALTPNEMVSDNEGPAHFRCSVATSATVQQEGSQELDWDIDLDHVPSSPIIEVSADELSMMGDEHSRGPPSQLPLAFSDDDDDIQCLSGGSISTTPAKASSAGDAPSEDDTAWLDALPLVERIKALGAMRRGSDVSRWANGSWKRARLSLASLGVPEPPGESTLPYDDEATAAAASLSDPFMSDDAFAGAVMVGGSSQGALPETGSSKGSAEPRAAVESAADARAGRSVLDSMAWDTLKDEELKRWMSFFGLKVTAGTTSRGNMIRTLGEIAKYVDKGSAAVAESSMAEPELPKRKRQKKSPAKKSREEKKREADEKRKTNKKALVHAIRKDADIWQRMLLFETIDITDLANRLKEQDPSLVCDQTLLRELLEEQGVQFCNTLQAGTQRHATRKPRGPPRHAARA